MQRIVESPSNSVLPEGKKCSQCQQFFGSPAFNGLCSKCYKEAQDKLKNKTSEKSNTVEQLEVAKEKPQEEKKTENNNDKKVCSVCKKKVGYLGFTCKCDKTFCKLHRMPEVHDCEYNFQDAAINKLKILNPVCAAKKMEYI